MYEQRAAYRSKLRSTGQQVEHMQVGPCGECSMPTWANPALRFPSCVQELSRCTSCYPYQRAEPFTPWRPTPGVYYLINSVAYSTSASFLLII